MRASKRKGQSPGDDGLILLAPKKSYAISFFAIAAAYHRSRLALVFRREGKALRKRAEEKERAIDLRAHAKRD